MTDNEKLGKQALSDEELEGVSGGIWQGEYCSIQENICCPNKECDDYTAIFYYKSVPRRCVKIYCPKCGYLRENENGL